MLEQLSFMHRSKPSEGETPALLTRTSILLLRNCVALFQRLCQSPGSVTSVVTKRTELSPNFFWKYVQVWCPSLSFMSAMTTLPPLASTLLVNSRPKPIAAPVMIKCPSIFCLLSPD